jgi:predicted mannosyl-3-phosphoglycerate phosphatase (HAD superfamily)
MINIDDIVAAARVHKNNITADINNASTRLEHVRLTALAQEAENLLTELENFAFGLVYSHSSTAVEERKLQQLTELSGLELEG